VWDWPPKFLNTMITKEEIQKWAQELKEQGDAPLFVGGWQEGVTWANEQNAAKFAELEGQIKDLQFIKEGDQALLKAANQHIEKQRSKLEILQGAYDTAISRAAELEVHIAQLEAYKAYLIEQAAMAESEANVRIAVLESELKKVNRLLENG